MSKLSVHQRKARDFIQKEDWGNALAELERMLQADGDNPTLHNQIGDVYLRKDDVLRACEHFESAIDHYAAVGLHNNAVALCKKVMRLRPGRFEMRYRLACLRLEQGFRSEAAAFFADYLEHAPADPSHGESLEAHCREMLDKLADEAPVGKALECLEAAERYAAAFEIVRTLAQRAADGGDDEAARRYTEKMRSLRILVERSGGRDPLADSVPAVEMPAAAATTVVPEAVAAAVPARPEPELELESLAPAAPEGESRSQYSIDPTTIDLGPGSPVPEPAPRAEPGSDSGLAALDAMIAAAAAAPVSEDDVPVHELDLDAAPGASQDGELSGLLAPEPAEPGPPQARIFDLDLGLESPAEPSATLSETTPPDDAPEAAPALPGDAQAAAGWTHPRPEAPVPAAPLGAGPGGTNWIEALRRAPVWIPAEGTPIEQVGDAWSEGASMELESVIDSFREQMARALDGDGAARYDLGVAYYDMGLYNEALAEFEAASRCPGLEVQSFEMLASCLLQTGRHHEVVELLLPVLAADGHSPRGRLGLQYSLGLAYEALGDPRQARRCFEEVALVDIDFKDVQSRLQRV